MGEDSNEFSIESLISRRLPRRGSEGMRAEWLVSSR
jgi:hypothetical protein